MHEGVLTERVFVWLVGSWSPDGLMEIMDFRNIL